jgi:hypothetical protein
VSDGQPMWQSVTSPTGTRHAMGVGARRTACGQVVFPAVTPRLARGGWVLGALTVAPYVTCGSCGLRWRRALLSGAPSTPMVTARRPTTTPCD